MGVEIQRTGKRFINESIVLPTYKAGWAVSLVEPYMNVEDIDFEYVAEKLRLRTIVYDGLKLVWAPDLFYALSKFDPKYQGIKIDYCVANIPEDIFGILMDLEVLDSVYYIKGRSVFLCSEGDMRNKDGIVDFVRRANSKRIFRLLTYGFFLILFDKLKGLWRPIHGTHQTTQ